MVIIPRQLYVLGLIFFDKYRNIERFILRRSSINEASVRDLASTYHEQSRVCK
jgi:hypothetical protein